MIKVSNDFKTRTKKIKQQNIKLSILDGELTVKEVHFMPVKQFNALPVWMLKARKKVVAKELKYSFEGNLFKTIMKQIEITVKNAGELKDKNVNFQYGIYVNNEFEYIDLGDYYIKDVEDNKGKTELVVTGYDKMIHFMKPFKQSELQLTYPCTMLTLIQKMCEVCGVELYSTDFFNADLQVDEDYFTAQELTYRDVLEKVAESTLTTIFIKDNKLYLHKLEGSLVQKLDSSYLTGLTVKEKFGPVNALVLGRGDVEDNVETKDDISIAQNGRCEIRFDENEFVEYQREQVIDEMFEQIKGLEYYAFEGSDVGVMWLEPCDFIEVEDTEGSTYKTMYLSANITINTGINSDIEAESPEETNTEYKVTTKEEKKTLKVERLAKKNEGQIQDLIQETTKQGQKITKVEQTVEGITQTVRKTSENLEQNYYTKTETNSQIDQKADSITQTVSKTYSTKEETDAKLEDYTKTEEFGTTIEQNWEHVKVAWNTISEFIQMEVLNNNASVAIRDDAKSLLMALDKAGQHFFENNKNFADMGVTTVKDGDYKGLMFVLMGEHSGTEIVPANNFMGFGYKAVVDGEEVVVPFLYFGKATASDENKLHVVGDAEFQGSIGVIGGTELGINYIKFANDFYLLDSNQMPVFSVYTNNEGTYTMDFGMNKLVADNVINSPTTMQIISDDYLASFFNKDGTQLTLYKENSDKRLKKNIKETTKKALDYIKQIKHFTYTWKNSNEKVDIGYVAQELEKVNKNFIRKHTYKTQEGKEDYDIQINTTNLLALVTKSIQEQQNEIEALKKEIEILKRGEKNE